MARFLILSEGGDGGGLALRLQEEGHEVRIWIRELDAEHRCEGLIEKTDDYEFGEIIVADCTGFGSILDALREAGRLVFSGSSLHDRLETDRRYAKKVMEDCNIETPSSIYLTGPDAWDQASEAIGESERLVFKPGGNLSGVLPSYVSKGPEDLLQMLEFFKSKISEAEPEFELQEFKDGIAISTEGWFNGSRFVGAFNHTIERKQLMVGDLGPSGGCTGNAVWIVDEEDDPLVGELRKLTSFLAKHRYIGPIDLNAVVSEEGIYGLEFTPRFGYDAFPTYLYGLFQENFGNFIASLARGDEPSIRLPIGHFAAGVRISIPPWPNEDNLASPGIPVRGLTSGDRKMFYPYDVMLKGDELVSSGGWGIIGVMNGVGASLKEAFGDVYRSVKHLEIPDMQYRTDLYEVCASDYRKVGSLLRSMV